MSGIALELIRQFAVFEIRTPGGYSLEAHTHALRIVMPTLLGNSQIEVYELPQKLGLHAVTLPEIPSMPNYNLAPWGPEDASEQAGDGFDDSKTDLDASTSYLSYGALQRQQDVLLNEELKDIDSNIECVDEGLQATDELTVRESESATQYVKEVEDDINTMFTETLRASLNDDGYLVSDYQPSVEDLAVPQLHAPLIIDGPRMTRRAEIYASGNVWARQVMAQADQAIEIRRLNALLVAAQHAIGVLEREEQMFQEQITQLEEANKFLSEAWQQVQERIQQNKIVQEKRDRLLQESDSLQQSRIAQENGGAGGSFLGFQGLRFRDRVGAGSAGWASNSPMISGDSPNLRFPFPGTRASTPGPNISPTSTANPYQSNFMPGAPTQNTPNARFHVQPSLKSSPGMGLRAPLAQPIPAQPVVSATGFNPSFLSRMGHHNQTGGARNQVVASFPSFGSFDSDSAVRASGVKGTGVTSGLAACDMSQPNTPHSFSGGDSEPQHSTSHSSIQGTGPGEAELAFDAPPHPSNSGILRQETSNAASAAIEPESELDDATLLSATVSAEQQLEQSPEQSA